jgi:hypothetical protein
MKYSDGDWTTLSVLRSLVFELNGHVPTAVPRMLLIFCNCAIRDKERRKTVLIEKMRRGGEKEKRREGR